MANENSALLSNDKMLVVEMRVLNEKKSVGVAYMLWFSSDFLESITSIWASRY